MFLFWLYTLKIWRNVLLRHSNSEFNTILTIQSRSYSCWDLFLESYFLHQTVLTVDFKESEITVSTDFSSVVGAVTIMGTGYKWSCLVSLYLQFYRWEKLSKLVIRSLTRYLHRIVRNFLYISLWKMKYRHTQI